jgi:AbrB family looped-hinge helix DNA binding protein
MEDRLEERVPKFYGSVVVGERGQIVIPVEARRDMDITPGEKLIILSGPPGNILMITKAESVSRLLSKAMERLSQFGDMLKIDDESPK